MSDEIDPPRKFYALKPTEFERLNAPAPAPAETSAEERAPAPAAPPPSRIDVREIARAATAGTPLLGVNAPANRSNDVHAMLRENLARADAAGLNDLAPRPKRASRRTRDYLLLLIPVDAFFAWWAFGPHANAMTFIYGIAGLAMFTAGLTWVMWFVMDDY